MQVVEHPELGSLENLRRPERTTVATDRRLQPGNTILTIYMPNGPAGDLGSRSESVHASGMGRRPWFGNAANLRAGSFSSPRETVGRDPNSTAGDCA